MSYNLPLKCRKNLRNCRQLSYPEFAFKLVKSALDQALLHLVVDVQSGLYVPMPHKLFYVWDIRNGLADPRAEGMAKMMCAEFGHKHRLAVMLLSIQGLRKIVVCQNTLEGIIDAARLIRISVAVHKDKALSAFDDRLAEALLFLILMVLKQNCVNVLKHRYLADTRLGF